MEIVYGVELTGMPLADYLSMLRDNGLGTLPGTAAEILDDEIRHILSANKLSTAQWIEVIRTAHRCGIRTTSTLMYGHTETPDALGAADAAAARNPVGNRRLHRIRAAGLRAPEHAAVPAGTRAHRSDAGRASEGSRAGSSAAAGSINNIQVSWVKLNRQLSQLCLHAGANDYGGTLMEENISREAGATAGQYTSPEDFQSLILEIGRIPAERNTTYSRIQH